MAKEGTAASATIIAAAAAAVRESQPPQTILQISARLFVHQTKNTKTQNLARWTIGRSNAQQQQLQRPIVRCPTSTGIGGPPSRSV